MRKCQDLSVRQPGSCFNVLAADKSSQSVVWISLYNYLVTRNNGVGPGNMPKTFNEPVMRLPFVCLYVCDTSMWVSVSSQLTYTHVPLCVRVCVAAGSCARWQKQEVISQKKKNAVQWGKVGIMR